MKFKLLLLIALQLFGTISYSMENNNNTTLITVNCLDSSIQVPLSLLNQCKTIKNLLRDFPDNKIDISPLSITAQTMDQLVQIMKDKEMINKIDLEDLNLLFEAADALEINNVVRNLIVQRIKTWTDLSALSGNQRKRLNYTGKSIKHLSNTVIEKIQKNGTEIDLSSYGLESINGLERFTNPGIWQKLIGIIKNPINGNIKKIDLSNNKLIACDINYIKQLFPNCEYINLKNNNIEKIPNNFLCIPSGSSIDLSQNCLHPESAQKLQTLLQNPTMFQNLRQKISHKIINYGLFSPLIGLPALGIIFVATNVASTIYLTDRCLELNINVLEKLLALPFLVGWSVMVAHGATLAATPFILGPTTLIDTGLCYIANKYANPFVPSMIIIDAQKKLKPTINDIKRLKKTFEIFCKTDGLKDLIYKKNQH